MVAADATERQTPASTSLSTGTVHEYFWIVCDNDFGWVQDGTRELAGERADRFQRQQLADLERRGLRPVVVSGPVADRVDQVHDALEGS